MTSTFYFKKHALNEVMSDIAVSQRLSDTKVEKVELKICDREKRNLGANRGKSTEYIHGSDAHGSTTRSLWLQTRGVRPRTAIH